MPNYRLSKIYKIYSKLLNLCYIGSTTQELSVRISDHYRDYNKWCNGCNKYISSFEVLKADDVVIILVEEFPCNTKHELYRKEGEYIKSSECVNKVVAGRTHKEYYEQNKEAIFANKHLYYEQNKEVINLQKKIYRELNQTAIKSQKKTYREQNKDDISAKKKIYQEQNKDAISAKKKIYQEQNKDAISAKKKERFMCECGESVRKCSINRHIQTNKHKNKTSFII
tara:strand:+ start:115 stop:792 length:678 start_codon:yes stop_codon:yes gene_type:complete